MTDLPLGFMLDFDTGETVNRYELYLLRDLPRTNQLVIKEPILRRSSSNNCLEATIEYLYIRSDIPDEYCQKGRLVFRNLRQGTSHGCLKFANYTDFSEMAFALEAERLSPK